MESILSKLNNTEKFVIYCAGEFATLLVQYCSVNGYADKISSCVVTQREPSTPAHILGVPVVELLELKQEEDILIIVAILSENAKHEIDDALRAAGYHNIHFLRKEEFRTINESLADFSADIKCELKRLLVQSQQQYNELFAQNQQHYESLSLLIQSMPVVAETHKQSFGRYKDINKGKNVVICAPGPSLNKYTFNDEYVHIGLNAVIFNENIKLDYYFNQHIPQSYDFGGSGYDIDPAGRHKYLEYFTKLKCVKFLGQKIGADWNISPPFGEFSDSNYCNYYISDVETTHRFFADIRYHFLYGSTSVIFPALQFALFTNPQRIFIVGSDGYSIDTANYYSKEEDNRLNARLPYPSEQENILISTNSRMTEIYKELREFADIRYPNTEIIMVNPVHFKGVFKETRTDEKGRILL